MTTWGRELAAAMNGQDPGPVIAYAPNQEAFDVPFDGGYGGRRSSSVLAWTERYVYFPVCYDGAEWMGSAPRNPVPDGQEHVGGG